MFEKTLLILIECAGRRESQLSLLKITWQIYSLPPMLLIFHPWGKVTALSILLVGVMKTRPSKTKT